MLNVCALYEHGTNGRPHGSAYIRTLLTLDHPSLKQELQVEFSTEFKPADILLIDRTWTPWIAPELAEQTILQARRHGSKIVYSLDDNLMDVNQYFPFRRVFSDEQVGAIRCFAREADHIIVSTEPLKERMQRINPHVSVIPNYLDEQLFSPTLPEKKASQKLIMGYMGTASHEADLLGILEPLRKLLSLHRNEVALELVGILDDHRRKLLFGDLPVSVRSVPKEAVEYPDFVKWMRENLTWDIGLAPLEKTPFTRCKSDIKWLDYSMLGIPGIFSCSEAYSPSIEDNRTGLLADSTPDDWFQKLQRMINDPFLRNTLRKNAFDTVRKSRTLGTYAQNWLETLKEIYSR